MIYAERGIGKTWVGLNVGHVVSGGGNYLGWQATRARRVVYIDGKMPSSVLKDRYATIVAGSEIDPPEENFWLVASYKRTGCQTFRTRRISASMMMKSAMLI